MSSAARVKPDFSNIVAIAVDDDNQVDSAVLGKIVFFTISDDLRVTSEELASLFDAFTIDQAFAPKAINPSAELNRLLKAFKQAAVIDGKRYDLEFLPEQKIDGSIEAPLVRRRRHGADEHGEEWDLRTVARIAWDSRLPTTIGSKVLSYSAHEHPYDSILTEVEEEFTDRCSFYTGSVIRSIVTKILNDASGIPVRPSGGVWLVPRDAMALLDRVEAMIQLLDAEYRRETKDGENAKGSRDTEFNSIYVVDTTRNRVFIAGKVEAKVNNDLESAVHQLYALASAGVKPRASDLVEIVRARRDALAVLEHYRGSIGDELGKVTSMLALFDRAYEAANRAGDTADPGAPQARPLVI